MKYEYTVYLQDAEGNTMKSFTYDDYDSVQNLLGYMVEGSTYLKVVISKKEVR